MTVSIACVIPTSASTLGGSTRVEAMGTTPVAAALTFPRCAACAPRAVSAARARNGTAGMPGTTAIPAIRTAATPSARGASDHLLGNIAAQRPARLFACHARHEDRRRCGDHDRRDLRDQALPNGQKPVTLHGIGNPHPALPHADRDPPHDVHDSDHDPCNGVALYELECAVHRAVERTLARELSTPPSGLGSIDRPGAHFGIDRQLLAGQSIEREPCGDFGHAFSTAGDHQVLHQRDDAEHHRAHHVVPVNHERPKGTDHRPRVAVSENQACRRDFEREPKEGGEQQDRGKRRRCADASGTYRAKRPASTMLAERLRDNSRSRTNVGSGTIMVATMATTTDARTRSGRARGFTAQPPASAYREWPPIGVNQTSDAAAQVPSPGAFVAAPQ